MSNSRTLRPAENGTVFSTREVEANVRIPQTHKRGKPNAQSFGYHPESEGELLALDRDTFPVHAVEVSWGILHGLVHDVTGNKPFKWTGSSQVMPFDMQLKSFFFSRWYRRNVLEKLRTSHFQLDNNRLDRLRSTGDLYRDPTGEI